MTRHEACLYFGVNEEELEQLVVDHDLLVELDPTGKIAFVHPEGTYEALHKRFKRAHGFRPDDPEVVARAKRRRAFKEQEEKKALREHTAKLKKRVMKTPNLDDE